MKVFDHIDFNKFFEDKKKFDFNIPRFQKAESFEKVVLENIEDLMLEMALGVTPGSGTSSAVRLDDDDILYLYQFIPKDWSKALWWRYGPGLITYARTRHQNIPEHEDEESHFHGVNKKGAFHQEEQTESIVFSEEHLFGSSAKAQEDIARDPTMGHGGDAKHGKLDWMKHDKFKPKAGKDGHLGGIGKEGKRKYLKIKFGWNKVYNKLNNQYKFAMQRVDDTNWKEKGMLPQLAGYKPMNYKGVDNSLNKHFKSMGMALHHPENHHGEIETSGDGVNRLANPHNDASLNWHQQNVLQHQYVNHGFDAMGGITSNDKRSPHNIVPIGSGTHNDRKWSQGHPHAHNDAHHLQGDDYKAHLYELMGLGLGKSYDDDNGRTVQPFHLTASKPGDSSSYNAYETFGLHKAMKLQNWELEKYFPMEMHEWAYNHLKRKVEKNAGSGSLADKISGMANPNQVISGEEIKDGIVDPNWEDFIQKLRRHETHKVPVHVNAGDIDPSKLEEINGVQYMEKDNNFVKEALGNTRAMPKWKWAFLNRFVNRFEGKLTRGITSPQHLGITSIYKSMPPEMINDTLNAHPELKFAHAGLEHKRSSVSEKDRIAREKEEVWNRTGSRRQVPYSLAKEPSDKEKPQHGFRLTGSTQEKDEKGNVRSPGYVHHKFSGKDEHGNPMELPHASHTDVMVGGVFHEFGGKNGNILEYHPKRYEWYPIPVQRFFVPLLHRGQVLPSEKQRTKGINVGSFGHSQVAEVETNHFGSDPDEDMHEVSEYTAKRYVKSGLKFKTLTDRIKETSDPHLKEELGKKLASEGEKYYVNKNEHFWKAASEGDHPSKEFFKSEKDDYNHNDVTRSTDHHQDHMEKFGDQENDQMIKYNTDITSGFSQQGGKATPFIHCGFPDESGMEILKSVHDGVQDAINSPDIRKNELLVDELTSELGSLWTYGTMILKANVAHPQFFQNQDYEKHLEKEYEDLPRDEDNKIDLEAEHMGQSFQGTHKTGANYRRSRVKNYIISFAQRPLSDNIPARRKRQGRTSGYVRGMEDHDLKRMARTHLESEEQTHISKKRKRGERRKVDATPFGLAETQSSYHTKMNRLLQAKGDAEGSMDVKSAQELMPIMQDARSNNLAMLCLWAIESAQVPQSRKIAIKHLGVSKEDALSPDFPKNHPKQYSKALVMQFDQAWKWAKAKQDAEWDERLKKSMAQGPDKNGDMHVYLGSTEAIPNGEFVKTQMDSNIVKSAFENTGRYDERASRGIITWNLVKSNIGSHDEDGIYAAMLPRVKKMMPHGIVDFHKVESEDSDAIDQFDQAFEGMHQYIRGEIPEEASREAVHAAYDYLLDSVNPDTVANEDFEEAKTKIMDNGSVVRSVLEESPYESIQSLGERFVRDLADRLKRLNVREAVETPHNVARHIVSSLNKSHEGSHGGKLGAMKEYNDSIEKLKHNQPKGWEAKIKAKEAERVVYEERYQKMASIIRNSKFDIGQLSELTDGLTKKDTLSPKIIEAAFIDEAIDYLSHLHNMFENGKTVVNAAKHLAKTSLGSSFWDTFRKEFDHIKKRHQEAA